MVKRKSVVKKKKELSWNVKSLTSLSILLGGFILWNNPNIQFRISTLGQSPAVESKITLTLHKSKGTIVKKINNKEVKWASFFIVRENGWDNIADIPPATFPLVNSNYGKNAPNGIEDITVRIMAVILKPKPDEKPKLQIGINEINKALEEKKPGTTFVTLMPIPCKKNGGALPVKYITDGLQANENNSNIKTLFIIFNTDKGLLDGVNEVIVKD